MKIILVIVGPTSSGKSDLAVRLAKRFDGEIISADSRQVYKGLDIGSGKITKREMRGIPHHLLDVANPQKQFSAEDFKQLSRKAIEKILAKNKLPIIAGGTGFYIDALTGQVDFPNVPPDKKVRARLGKLSTDKLLRMLRKRDPKRASTIDTHNRVRIIRALEIAEALGKVPTPRPARSRSYNFAYMGIKPDNLDQKILVRLKKRKSGIIREVRKLIERKKLTHKRMQELGLEYRYASLFLQKKLDREEFEKKLFIAIRQYAKRQMTWFKRNKEIKWFKPNEFRNIEKYVKVALKGD